MPAVDYGTITKAQQATWSAGDFHVVARGIVGVSDRLCDAALLHAGERVLDVACGSGNAALNAARRYCDVSGIDYVPALVERASKRAEAELLDIDFRIGDAQALPFADASFDAVLSVFGIMFAPDQEKTARELLRVTRPGGRIALANWMPEAFGLDFFGAHARYNPPPQGVASPLRWGTDEGLRNLFGDAVSAISSKRQTHYSHMRSIDHAVEVFATYFGPTVRAIECVGPNSEATLRDDLATVFSKYDVSKDASAIVEMTYYETVAIRR